MAETPASRSPWLRPPAPVVCLAALVLLTLSMSLGRWLMEGAPRSYWREQHPGHTHRWCPDGMDLTIRAFVETLRGTEHAREFYLDRLRTSHQSSTMLVEWSCAPLVLLGLEEAVAFATVSSLASLLVVLLLWRLVREELGSPRDRLLAMGLFLAHPGTVRCFSRPQTDALLALFALLAAVQGRRLALRGGGLGPRALLVLTGSLGCFVKIHAVALILVPPAVGFVYGARGRRLGELLLFGTLLPGLVWLSVFAGLDLFGSIRAAWEYKEQFYAHWDAATTAKVLALSSGPLLLALALHPRGWRGLPAAAWILVLGFTAILVGGGLPPTVRFQYPVVALACVAAVSAVRARWPGRAGLGLLTAMMACWYAVDWLLVGWDLMARYLGNPAKVLPKLLIFLQ